MVYAKIEKSGNSYRLSFSGDFENEKKNFKNIYGARHYLRHQLANNYFIPVSDTLFYKS